MDMIFCFGGNAKAGTIATENGWLYGSQPTTVYSQSISFVDLDFKNMCNDDYLDKYQKFVKSVQPKYAVLPDVFCVDDLSRVHTYAKTLSGFVENFIVVPKFSGCIENIPENLYDTRVILGYSVPTRYGGTSVPIWEFVDRPVHLLGGSPIKQRYLLNYLNVVSLDGNYCSKIAGYGGYISSKDLSQLHNKTAKWLDLIAVSLKNISVYYQSELARTP